MSHLEDEPTKTSLASLEKKEVKKIAPALEEKTLASTMQRSMSLSVLAPQVKPMEVLAF